VCVCAAARVRDQFSTRHGVRGVTSLDDKLFVLLKLNDNPDKYQVAVYSMDDYRDLSCHLDVPGTIKDMTSCVRNKCLYMSDWDNSCIHRYQLDSGTLSAKIKHVEVSGTSKWSLPEPDSPHPLGLSVIPNSGNLLVICQEPNVLVELSAESGKIVHKIQLGLQPQIEWPHDGVQLTNGQIVVCYGCDRDPEHRSRHGVCVLGKVDDRDNVTTICEVEGGFDQKHLKWPRHFAVAEDSQSQFTGLFVADESNNTVVLLSPTLEFVRNVIEGLSKPCRVYFHTASQRLFVGQLDGGVIIVQL